eukprot:tig00021314_g20114.t1
MGKALIEDKNVEAIQNAEGFSKAFEDSINRVLAVVRRIPMGLLSVADKIALCHSASLQGPAAEKWDLLRKECARLGSGEPTWTTAPAIKKHSGSDSQKATVTVHLPRADEATPADVLTVFTEGFSTDEVAELAFTKAVKRVRTGRQSNN